MLIQNISAWTHRILYYSMYRCCLMHVFVNVTTIVSLNDFLKTTFRTFQTLILVKMQKHKHEFDSVHKCVTFVFPWAAHVVCCRKLEICTEKAKRSSRWRRIAPVWRSSCSVVGMESPWMPRVDRTSCWTTPPAERRGSAAFSTPFSTRETLSSVI